VTRLISERCDLVVPIVSVDAGVPQQMYGWSGQPEAEGRQQTAIDGRDDALCHVTAPQCYLT
jgi:hypothetical protein